MESLLSRYFVLQLVCLFSLACGALALSLDPWWAAPLFVLVPLVAVGVYDLIQRPTRSCATIRSSATCGSSSRRPPGAAPVHDRGRPRSGAVQPRSARRWSISGPRTSTTPSPSARSKTLPPSATAGSRHSIRPTTLTDHDFRITIGGPDLRATLFGLGVQHLRHELRRGQRQRHHGAQRRRQAWAASPTTPAKARSAPTTADMAATSSGRSPAAISAAARRTAISIRIFSAGRRSTRRSR